MLQKLLKVLGIIGIIIVIGLAGALGKNIVSGLFSTTKPSQQQREATLIEGFTATANQTNLKLPIMVDKDTRMDKVTVGPGPRVVYHQTMVNYTSSDLDAMEFQTNIRQNVSRNVCSNSDMKPSLQLGGIYTYLYYGIDGVEAARVEIRRKDCEL